jgi:hypothetical protein
MKKLIHTFFGTFACVSILQAAASDSFTFSNHIRFGHDDNLYQESSNEEETSYISDILNISGKLLFSNRSELLLYWQPEIRYRFEAEEKTQFLQDLYAKYINAIDQSSQFQITDRFRYSELEANQSGSTGPREYAENDLKGAYIKQLNGKNSINLSTGFTARRYDNDSRAFNQTRNFDRSNISGIISRNLDRDKRTVSLGYVFSEHEVENNAGGIQSGLLFLGYDQIFNPKFLGSIQLGYTDAEIEQKNGITDLSVTSDSSNPYFEIGFNYDLSERTSVGSTFSHSLRYSTTAIYNAEKRSDWLITLSHDLTAKIDLNASLSYVMSDYESDFLRDIGSTSGEVEDQTTIVNIRADYQINRNHFVEIGYQGRSRNTEISANGDYDKNRIYLGWKLEL